MTVTATPRLIQRVRRQHWIALDRAAAGAYALLILPILIKYAEGPPAVPAVLGGLAAFAAPIAVRRSRPLAASVLLVAGLIGTLLMEPRVYIATIAPMAAMVYIVAATRTRRTALLLLAVSLAGAAAAALPDFTHLGATAASAFAYLTIWTIGCAVAMHRRFTAELLQHQAQLARAELEQARRDVLEERVHIARELHDMIAHSMSVITVQSAFGALVFDTQPEQARSALETIESTGRQTLSELRAMLGMLRTTDLPGAPEPSFLGPCPSLADLDQLIARTERAGVQARLTVSTTHPMSPGVELTAYRVVQEALTNVVKHARTNTAQVLIDEVGDHLIIEITDDGDAATRPDRPPGHGLIGMRERVLAYGGVLHAGASATGGFRVHARIPLDFQPAQAEQACPTQPV